MKKTDHIYYVSKYKFYIVRKCSNGEFLVCYGPYYDLTEAKEYLLCLLESLSKKLKRKYEYIIMRENFILERFELDAIKDN